MKYYGTKNNKDYGFYIEKFDGAIEISDEYWAELLEKQNTGNRIIPFENKVIAIDENEYVFENNYWKQLNDNEIQIRQLNIQTAIKIENLQNELEELDKKRIRAIAEPSMKDENLTWLEYYNYQILNIRQELSNLL